MTNKKPLIVLTGPTAVGKTKCSIELAKKIGGEIISADSMQVYRYMNIGTDKITKQEMDGVPHHLIDILDPTESFNVTMFQKFAKEAVEAILHRGRIPIIVGGTGFYIQALLYDIDFSEGKEDLSLRNHYSKICEERGKEALHEMLRKVDAEAAEAIPSGNVKRVIRALEYYDLTGERISEHNRRQRGKTSPYQFHYFVLTRERALLYEKIDRRVEEMMERGLEGEVRSLLEGTYRQDGSRAASEQMQKETVPLQIVDSSLALSDRMTSMQGLGYREMADFFAGKCSRERAVLRIKQNTRHFAKRQLTWFRREKEVIWINKADFGEDDLRIVQEVQKGL